MADGVEVLEDLEAELGTPSPPPPPPPRHADTSFRRLLAGMGEFELFK